MVQSAVDFEDTRTLTIGGKSKDELLQDLEEASVHLNDYARSLFADRDFTTSNERSEVAVAFVRLDEIGLPNGGRYDEILAHGEVAGLQPCPLELAPTLRLAYRDQSEGPYLTVASEELRPGSETPNGFYLRRLAGELWLRGYESGPENVYGPDFSRFVFVQPQIGPTRRR